MSKSVSNILQQVWRVGRLFVGSLVAQLYLLPAGKLSEKLIVSAIVAAGEATYRQISPAGSARILGTVASLFGALSSAASTSQGITVHVNAGSSVTAEEVANAVGSLVSSKEISSLANGGVIPPPRVNIVNTQPAVVPSTQPGQTPSEAPTGADGQPLNVVHSGS